MTSKLTRTAWGLSTPRDTVTTPCVDEPDRWVLPIQRMGRAPAVQRLTPDNAEALRICLSCPVRERCRSDWEALPPEQRAGFIAGAVVWNYRGQPADTYRAVTS